jgi:peptide/nickel transport system substrate-binding protein
LAQNWDDPAYAAFKKKSDAAKVETNRTKQAAMWKELSQYVMDQYWIIRPVFSKTQEVWGSKVGGVYYWEPQGNFGFGQMYVKN